jgi:hypothetical protein
MVSALSFVLQRVGVLYLQDVLRSQLVYYIKNSVGSATELFQVIKTLSGLLYITLELRSLPRGDCRATNLLRHNLNIYPISILGQRDRLRNVLQV